MTVLERTLTRILVLAVLAACIVSESLAVSEVSSVDWPLHAGVDPSAEVVVQHICKVME